MKNIFTIKSLKFFKKHPPATQDIKRLRYKFTFLDAEVQATVTAPERRLLQLGLCLSYQVVSDRTPVFNCFLGEKQKKMWQVSFGWELPEGGTEEGMKLDTRLHSGQAFLGHPESQEFTREKEMMYHSEDLLWRISL